MPSHLLSAGNSGSPSDSLGSFEDLEVSEGRVQWGGHSSDVRER